jgi:hypothetical protein
MNGQNSVLRLITIGIILALAGLACGKDEFTSKPKLEFLKADSYDVSQNQYLTFRLKVLDKEGDISDTIWIKAGTRRCPNNVRTLDYLVPVVPEKANLDAEIVIQYINGSTNDPDNPIWPFNLCSGVDTTNFEFWIKDKAGNFSDTVKTDQPVLIRNN